MSEPIFDAIKSGDIAQFNTALQASGAASARGEMNVTPLMLAASLGNLEMVRALLKAGVDVKATDERDYTALFYGTYNPELDRGYPEVVKALIEAGAEVETQIFYGVRPLMLAAGSGEAGVVDVLLKAGADPKARNEGGRTALMMVKEKDYIEVINMLHEAETAVEAAEDGAGCGSRNAPGSNVVTFLKKDKH